MFRINLFQSVRLAIASWIGGDARRQRFGMEEAARALRNFDIEYTRGGIVIPRMGVFIGGMFKHRARKIGGNPLNPFGYGAWEPWSLDPNAMANQGLNYILNVALGNQSQIAAFYLAPFAGNVTPDGTWTAANFTSNGTEFLAYTPTTRPSWNLLTPVANAPTTTESLGNTGNEAVITFTSGGPYNLYGLGLISNATKSSTSGTLIAATRFASPRLSQNAGDQLAFGYVITAADAG